MQILFLSMTILAAPPSAPATSAPAPVAQAAVDSLDAMSVDQLLRKARDAMTQGDANQVRAALTLARRGDRSVLPQLLKIRFATEFRARLNVLLSNSAAASSLPQPGRTDLLAWWQRHGAAVKLADPWLPALEKRKVD